MKYLYFILLQVAAASAYSQLDVPSWLLPDTLGQYVAVNGQMMLSKDSLETGGTISIIRHGKEDDIYHFYTDRNGAFVIYLPANGHYSVRFEKKGHISKSIDVFTVNVPKKAWKTTFAIDLAAYMEPKPLGFDENISKIPYNIVKYSPEVKFFIFDEEFETIRRKALDKEIQRCSQSKALSGVKF